ncbi:hypothetical protein ACHAWT_000497, partial [Skeletonema menzelii]
MEGLVSPSPESFNAIHLALARVNAAVSININDIVALSRYLSKPNYTMALFHDDGIIKWRMVENDTGISAEEVLVDSNIITEKGGRELYHGFSTLQLSQMALELATNETNHNHDANLLSKIHEVAYQAEKRIALTMGSDSRGPQSADACFNFALAGVHKSSASLFQNLVRIEGNDLYTSSPLERLFDTTPTHSVDADEYGLSSSEELVNIFDTTPTPLSDDDEYDLVGQCSIWSVFGRYSLGRCSHATSLENTHEFDESVDHSNEIKAATTPVVQETTTPTNEIEASTPADLNEFVPFSGRARQYWNQHEDWLFTIATFHSLSIDLNYRRQEHQEKVIWLLYYGQNWWRYVPSHLIMWHLPYFFLKYIMGEYSAKSSLLRFYYLIEIGLRCVCFLFGSFLRLKIIASLAMPLMGVIHLRSSFDICLYTLFFLWNATFVPKNDKTIARYLIWRWNKAHQAFCSYYSSAAVLLWLRKICIEGDTYSTLIVASLSLVFVATALECWAPSASHAFWNKSKSILQRILMWLICILLTWRRDFSTTSSPAETTSSRRTTSASSRSRKGGRCLWRRIIAVLMFALLWLEGADANSTPSKAVGKASSSASFAAAKPTKRKHKRKHGETSTTRESMQNDAFDALSDEVLKRRVWKMLKKKNVPKLIQDRLFPHIDLVSSPEGKTLIRAFYIECLDDGSDSPINTIVYDEASCQLVKKLKELESRLKRQFTAEERTYYQVKALKIYKLAVDGKAFCYANKSCAEGEDDAPSKHEDTAITHNSGRDNAFLCRNDDSGSEYTGRPVTKSLDVQLNGEQAKGSHLITTRYFKVAKFGQKKQAEAFYVELLLTAVLRMKDRRGHFHCLNRNYYFVFSADLRKEWQFAGITLFCCAEAMESGEIGLNSAWDPEIELECFIPNKNVYTMAPRLSGEDRSHGHKFMTFVKECEKKLSSESEKYTFFYYDDFEGGPESIHWRRYAEMIGFLQSTKYSLPTKRWQLDLLAKVKIFPNKDRYKKRAIKYIREMYKSQLQSSGKGMRFDSHCHGHIAEKFAASDVRSEDALELYQIAADCLEKKNYNDKMYIESLRNGSFGFHGRPLLWLWRFSSRQKKVEIFHEEKSKWKEAINWQDEFQDTNKPLVVDIGSGMGTCILGLASTKSTIHEKLPIKWSQCNYVGVDLNQALVRFGNGVASRRSDAKKGNTKFFCCPADEFLTKLKSYPSRKTLIMVNFPSPYRLALGELGNLQLPSAENFMVTSKLLEQISVLARSDTGETYFMFQTKCEDVAVYLKNECLHNGMEGIIAGDKAVQSIDKIYSQNKSVPKRVKEWLRIEPLAERAEGNLFWRQPILPLDCLPET